MIGRVAGYDAVLLDVLLPDRPELIRFRLQDGEYVESGRTAGRRRVRVSEPFPVTVDLARLVV